MSAITIQDEFREIEKGSSTKVIIELIEFIEEALPDFTQSQEFVNILEKKRNENQHTTALCVFMIYKSKLKKYCFLPGNAQKGTHSTDIAIYYGSNIIFTIEAKLLPTPKGTRTKPRNEYEYVFGKGAGIQRFRDGFHGVDNYDNPIPENGMIAYIKENDFEYWFSKVNQWVLDAQWEESEQLKKISFKSIGKLISNHPRFKAPDVILYHFWIYVN